MFLTLADHLDQPVLVRPDRVSALTPTTVLVADRPTRATRLVVDGEAIVVQGTPEVVADLLAEVPRKRIALREAADLTEKRPGEKAPTGVAQCQDPGGSCRKWCGPGVCIRQVR